MRVGVGVGVAVAVGVGVGVGVEVAVAVGVGVGVSVGAMRPWRLQAQDVAASEMTMVKTMQSGRWMTFITISFRVLAALAGTFHSRKYG